MPNHLTLAAAAGHAACCADTHILVLYPFYNVVFVLRTPMRTSLCICSVLLPPMSTSWGWVCASAQESAQDKSQKYKEGKYILERSKMVNADEGLMCAAVGHLMDSDCEDAIAA